MVTCKDCAKTVTHPKSRSWDNLLCPDCKHKENLLFIENKNIFGFVRRKTIPVDIHLDRGTLYELEKMN